jgi:hypothetical protein
VRRVFVLFCAVPLLASCGASPSDSGGGELAQGLQVSPSATVTQATYTITGPNGFASAGTVPVGESPDVPVVVSNLPVGTGYVIELHATASDGVIVCTGSFGFDVPTANATLNLIVHLTCAVPSGDVEAEAVINICPVLDGLTASPLALRPGGVSSLFVDAHDSDQGPTPLAYSWFVNGIKLSQQTLPALGFACSSLGPVTIAASVSDGQCSDGESVQVSCE